MYIQKKKRISDEKSHVMDDHKLNCTYRTKNE